MVDQTSDGRSADKHQKGQPRKLQVVRSGRRNQIHGRKDDVRPASEGNGPANFRRAKETGRSQELYESPSRDGFLQM